MAAIASKQLLLNVDDKEARMLADAVAECGKQFGTTINPKVLAVMQLGGAAAAIYGPRAFMIMSMRPAKPQQRPGGGSNVREIRPQQPPAGGATPSIMTDSPPADVSGTPIKFD